MQACLEAGIQEGLTLVSLVLTFGFLGSPGAWTPWGDSTCEYHCAHRPEKPEVDGPFRYRSHILMDDLVLVEPALGMRPWNSRATAGKGIV